MINFNFVERQKETKEYQAAIVTKVTGVKRARLQTWLEKGWITPSIQVGDGPGVRNIFNRNDLYWIAIFKMIIEIGLPRNVVGDLLARLKELSIYSLQGIDKEGTNYCYNTILYVSKNGDTKATLLTKTDFLFGKQLSSLGLNDYDFSFIFNTYKALTEVDKKINELGL